MPSVIRFPRSSACVRSRLGTAALAAVLAASMATGAAAFEIVPHRAIYKLDLASTSNPTAISDVNGEMMFQWSDSCDGWTVEQRYRMNFLDAEGAAVEQSSVYATWESKDGNAFTFSVRNTTNGVVDKEVRGRATLDGEGRSGSVTFRLPEEVTQDLPPGTIFPTAHTLKMLEIAEAGDGPPFFNALLFDGSGLDSLREINAVIGAGQTSAENGRFDLLDRPFWPIELAFYPEERREAVPEYEMSVSLHDNGVINDMIIDYGTFAVSASLNMLEPIEDGGC